MRENMIESGYVWHVKRSVTRLVIVELIVVWVHEPRSPIRLDILSLQMPPYDDTNKTQACTGVTTPERGQKRSIHASTQEAKKPDNHDVSSLLRTLRHKDSWRCTCKATRPAPKMKAKSAIAGKSHDAKCMLQRTGFGERRWDGKNMGITLEQLQYLADRNLY